MCRPISIANFFHTPRPFQDLHPTIIIVGFITVFSNQKSV